MINTIEIASRSLCANQRAIKGLTDMHHLDKKYSYAHRCRRCSWQYRCTADREVCNSRRTRTRARGNALQMIMRYAMMYTEWVNECVSMCVWVGELLESRQVTIESVCECLCGCVYLWRPDSRSHRFHLDSPESRRISSLTEYTGQSHTRNNIFRTHRDCRCPRGLFLGQSLDLLKCVWVCLCMCVKQRWKDKRHVSWVSS